MHMTSTTSAGLGCRGIVEFREVITGRQIVRAVISHFAPAPFVLIRVLLAGTPFSLRRYWSGNGRSWISRQSPWMMASYSSEGAEHALRTPLRQQYEALIRSGIEADVTALEIRAF